MAPRRTDCDCDSFRRPVVSVQDARQPNSRTTLRRPVMSSAQWNPHNMATFAVITEDGNLTLHDARNASSPVFTLNAHSESLTACDFSPRSWTATSRQQTRRSSFGTSTAACPALRPNLGIVSMRSVCSACPFACTLSDLIFCC